MSSLAQTSNILFPDMSKNQFLETRYIDLIKYAWFTVHGVTRLINF